MTRVIGVAHKPAARETEIARLFDAAHYDWDDPLSAKSYSAWRGQLPRFQDAIASQPNSYEIKTTTEGSELLTATLKLRSSDLEPIEGRFEFRNRDWVEMTELVDQQTNPASTVAGTTGGMPHQPGMPPAPHNVAVETAEPSAFSEELQVVSALHQLGADLGDPLEISREGRQVLVSGIGIPPQRQQQIHGLLDRLPHVVVRFDDPAFPASATPVQSEPATRDAAGPEKSTYTARIEERLGGRPQFERFSSSVLDWTDSAMTRAYALRRLAQQFSAEAESQMTAEDRRTLRKLGREHLAAFAKDAQRVANTVNPVLKGVAPGHGTRSRLARIPSRWQSASEDLLASARRAETLLAVVLGVAPADNATGNAPAQLLVALAQLSSRIEAVPASARGPIDVHFQPSSVDVSGNPLVFCRTIVHRQPRMNAGPLVAVFLAFLSLVRRHGPSARPTSTAASSTLRRPPFPKPPSLSSTRRAVSAMSPRPPPAGDYAVGSLESGTYKVTVRKDGFRTMIRFNVKVANLEAAQVDFALSVGAVQETITVEGTAPLTGQEDASIGVRVFREDIQRLPLNGRGVLGLLELSPGTNVTPATRGEAGQFTANGQRPNANYFTVDGASANTGVTAGGLPAQATGGVLPAMSAFGSLDSLLPVEAVDELRVQTSNTVSELGRLPGANVALTSRSGSNEFHGSAIYRFRHELLAANDWFANVSGERRGPLRLHDIAPSFGGPIRRNRTFFFLSYQHMTLARIVRFPPARALAGHPRRRAVLGPARARSLPAGQRPRLGPRSRRVVRPQRPALATR